MMKEKYTVAIDYVHPPIPIRNFDYQAWVVGNEEGESGNGATRAAALASLADLLGVEVEDFEIVGAVPAEVVAGQKGKS